MSKKEIAKKINSKFKAFESQHEWQENSESLEFRVKNSGNGPYWYIDFTSSKNTPVIKLHQDIFTEDEAQAICDQLNQGWMFITDLMYKKVIDKEQAFEDSFEINGGDDAE